MLRAAMAAPTDKNRQPWHFVVLNTPESIAQYAGEGHHAERMKKTPPERPAQPKDKWDEQKVTYGLWK